MLNQTKSQFKVCNISGKLGAGVDEWISNLME